MEKFRETRVLIKFYIFKNLRNYINVAFIIFIKEVSSNFYKIFFGDFFKFYSAMTWENGELCSRYRSVYYVRFVNVILRQIADRERRTVELYCALHHVIVVTSFHWASCGELNHGELLNRG